MATHNLNTSYAACISLAGASGAHADRIKYCVVKRKHNESPVLQIDGQLLCKD